MHPESASRPLLLGTLLILAALPAEAEVIGFSPSWKTSDRVAYAITRCDRTNSTTERPEICVTSRLDIEVLHADKRGSVQRWKSGGPVAGLDSGGLWPEAKKAFTEAAEVPAEIEFDEAGAPVRIVNAAQMREAIEKTLAATGAGVRPRDGRVLLLEMELKKRLRGGNERLVANAMADPSVLHFPMGRRFSTDGPLETESSLISPYALTPLRSKVRVTATRASAEAQEIGLDREETADPEAVAQHQEMVMSHTRNLVRVLLDAEVPAKFMMPSHPPVVSVKASYWIRAGQSWPWRVILEHRKQSGESWESKSSEYARID